MLKHLVEVNQYHLQEAIGLIGQLQDPQYAEPPLLFPNQKAGAHIRHVIEFYECFLNGLATRRLDYDARRRDEQVERCRTVAIERLHMLVAEIGKVRHAPADWNLLVHVEAGEGFLESSAARELQALASHTVHHFAIVSMILKLHGVQPPESFGVAASTLRYRAGREAA